MGNMQDTVQYVLDLLLFYRYTSASLWQTSLPGRERQNWEHSTRTVTCYPRDTVKQLVVIKIKLYFCEAMFHGLTLQLNIHVSSLHNSVSSHVKVTVTYKVPCQILGHGHFKNKSYILFVFYHIMFPQSVTTS